MAALAVLWAPVRTLARVAEERRVLPAFGVTALYAALGLVSNALVFLVGFAQARLAAQGQPLLPGFEGFVAVIGAFALVLGVLATFVYWLLVSGLMHLVTHFFGGSGPFSGTLAAVGVAQVPLVISAALTLPLTGLQILLASESIATEPSIGLAASLIAILSGLIGLAASLWFAALVVVGAALARRVGYGESAGSCAISCAGCFGLIIVLAVAIVALAAIVAGASGSAGAL